MSKTIAEIVGIPVVEPAQFNKATPIKCADPQLIQGVELEIEGVPHYDSFRVAGIRNVEDGSLRNAGREFITSPATFSHMHFMLSKFFEIAKLTEANYSERTSVHVHCNVGDLTPAQLGVVLLLYQAFEPLLFQFVGGERDKNIFCVPWSETNLTYEIVKSMSEGDIFKAKRWQKYTALNLIPITTQGSIEFRHMPGNCNLEHIENWLNLIGSMFAYARKNEFDKVKDTLVELNTSSEYSALTESVFTDWAVHLTRMPNYTHFLEEGVLNMKYSILNNATRLDAPSVVDFDDGIPEALGRPRGTSIYSTRPLSTAASDMRADIERRNRLAISSAQAQIEAANASMAGNAAPGGARPNDPFSQPRPRPARLYPERNPFLQTGTTSGRSEDQLVRFNPVTGEQLRPKPNRPRPSSSRSRPESPTGTGLTSRAPGTGNSSNGSSTTLPQENEPF